ncbi:MAG: leucyl/phenylalanyl-tRNA--protein transferase [Acidobacteria bacterium]|nr:leucyl/phenylalanyl-tRNA--protein transferase [Acidobacteriota bacterium]MCW5948334.1 leucyl/phenylalanyl-tRNA--protein transferase [Pyrinomonadaceae bacterium]
MAFPDPQEYEFPSVVRIGDQYLSSEDVVAFGIEPTVENLIEAYSKGIFPWPMEGVPLPWFCPRRRAVIEFTELRVPRSLAKERRRSRFTFTIDADFAGVVRECALSVRPGQDGTWITSEVVDRYTELHKAGHAHSVEAWDADGNLAGGLYGVDAGGVFCGESMFFRQPNASKLALLYLIDHMKQKGATWLDCQVMTPHMRALGAVEISRGEFLEMLAGSRACSRKAV